MTGEYDLPIIGGGINDAAGLADGPGLRLVRGGRIVVPALYKNDHAFILQNDKDG